VYGAASPKELQTLHEFFAQNIIPHRMYRFKDELYTLMKTSGKHHQIL
jgi:hypothetical protein